MREKFYGYLVRRKDIPHRTSLKFVTETTLDGANKRARVLFGDRLAQYVGYGMKETLKEDAKRLQGGLTYA